MEVPEAIPASDYCTLPEWDEEKLLAEQRPGVPQDPYKVLRDVVLSFIFYILPFAGPMFAFLEWQNILMLVHSVIGEERQLLELTQVTLTPATNGIVVSSLAIALGTLTSITVSSLRQRQLIVRQCLNKEACELALLRAAIAAGLAPQASPPAAVAGTREMSMYLQVLELVRAYVARVMSESSSLANTVQLEEQCLADTELLGVLDTFRAAGAPKPYTVYPLRDEATMRITRLNDSRSERLAYITTSFPLIHWVILALLAASIALCFLIEVDQSEGRFLAEKPQDSLRLRIVFTLMTGAFSGLTALCADLNDPFRGSFNVERCTRQFKTTIQVLDVEIRQIRESTSCFGPKP